MMAPAHREIPFAAPLRGAFPSARSCSKQAVMKSRPAPSFIDIAVLRHGVRNGERAVLARAITLAESKPAVHRHAARELVQDLLPHTGHAVRVGITGAPGVGKSTSIDTLGTYSPKRATKWRC